MLLKAENLCVYLRSSGERLVDNISFTLDLGESLVILGQSGSGKTMTCRALMGILNRKQFEAEGKILLNGINLLTIREKERKDIYGSKISMIPQNPMTALDPSAKVGKQMSETLRLHKSISKADARICCLNALEVSGLPECERVYRSYPFQLSGGMLQRVIIAMALMMESELIVADEPTTALDAVHRNETIDSFIALRKKGAAVLMVTHDFSDASKLGGNLLVMKDGNIVEKGKMLEILNSPKHSYTRQLLEATRLSYERQRGEAVC